MRIKTLALSRAVAALVAGLACSPFIVAQPGNQQHWVATWAASPQARAGGPPRAAQPAANGAPAAPPPLTSFNNQTVRMVVHTSIGGPKLRVEFSNAYGTAPLKIAAAHVALHEKESAIVPASDHALLFNGKASFSIPPGALAVSDPLEFAVPWLGDLVISAYFPSDTGPFTMHNTGLHTTYIVSGNAVDQAALTDATMTRSWYFLSGVDVDAPSARGLIAAFGDSITDGATSTNDANASWPSVLAARLAINNIAVVNEGISGNRVLRDNTGTNALARFDRDVLSQPGLKWVMILEGINDIGQGTRENALPENVMTLYDLIGGMKQLVDRAHIRGIKVVGCTLTPYKGAAYYSDKGEEIRMAYNQWIRTSGVFDAVADFDKATGDPADPKQIKAEFNIMDHLHPNDAGYKAMANAVDVCRFFLDGQSAENCVH